MHNLFQVPLGDQGVVLHLSQSIATNKALTFLLMTKAHGSNKCTENVESLNVHLQFVIDPLNLTETGK